MGEEKLRFILKSSPNARVTIVAPVMSRELSEVLTAYHEEWMGPLKAGQPVAQREAGLWHTAAGGTIRWEGREFRAADVKEADLIVAATNLRRVNRAVYKAAKAERRLCNIADTPELCDFYLGSIVTRGPLKVAISTNGQSPTFAKRFRQWLEAELPEAETTDLIDNLKLFRDRLTGDFQSKVRELNTLTSSLLGSDRAGQRCPAGGCLLAAAAEDSTTPPHNLENE